MATLELLGDVFDLFIFDRKSDNTIIGLDIALEIQNAIEKKNLSSFKGSYHAGSLPVVDNKEKRTKCDKISTQNQVF